jgi:hypothetical protein
MPTFEPPCLTEKDLPTQMKSSMDKDLAAIAKFRDAPIAMAPSSYRGKLFPMLL